VVEVGADLVSLISILLLVIAVQFVVSSLSQGHALGKLQQSLLVSPGVQESASPDHMKLLLLEDPPLTRIFFEDVRHLFGCMLVAFRLNLLIG
jgi:hypothetical protein